jgi:hypothetical protein
MNRIAYCCWAGIAFSIVVVTLKAVPLLIALRLP